MTKEKFSIIAIEETSNWDQSLLEANGIDAAFGYYLIRHGEATHICSFTPNSWCYFIKNDFVYDGDNKTAREFAGDNYSEGGESDYFGFMDPETMDSRFIAETFTIEMEADLDSMERNDPAREAYHDELWKRAEEEAHEFNCNGLEASICEPRTYATYQAEQLAKRHAQNVKPLAGRDQLPLFVMQAKREGIDTYEAARAAELI